MTNPTHKTAVIAVRVTPEVRERIRVAAARAGVSMSSYVAEYGAWSAPPVAETPQEEPSHD